MQGQELSGALRAALSASTPSPLTGRGAVTCCPGDPRLPYALAYLAMGWPVFILGRRTKRPLANCPACRPVAPTAPGGRHDPAGCGCLTCHGFYAATLDPDRVRAMLAANRRGLLAIRTGAASGLVGFDVDPRHGGRIDPEVMPPTASVASGGADRGWHLLYAHPGGYVPSRELPGRRGVDVKGDGGYLVAPPSPHPVTGRAYRWVGGREVREMHPALADLARAVVRPSPPSPRPERAGRPVARPSVAGGGCISSPERLLTAHLDAVARAPEGRRRRTLYGAARGVARMVAAGALTEHRALDELHAAGHAAGQTTAQIRNAITGAFAAEGVPLTDTDAP